MIRVTHMRADGFIITVEMWIDDDFRRINYGSVEMIYADGPELDMIRTRLVNIPLPHPSAKSALWLGDIAKFIAANIKGDL